MERFVIPAIGSLLLIGLTTTAISLVSRAINFQNVGIIYLLPVFVAALRWGFLPAIFAAIVSVGASAFFFYPPIYSFRAHNWDNQVDLVLFVIIAAVTSHLTTRLRRHEEVDRLRNALIGSVSHELRTPLASIVGAASVIGNSPTAKSDPRVSALAGVIREEANRLNNDIQNFLDASRISSEGIHPKQEWIDPADIVNVAIERREPYLSARDVKLTIANSLPYFLGDAVLIDQALGQILNNAAKYSPPGSEILVDVLHRSGRIAITVTDRGAGLTPEELDRWGDRFFRGKRAEQTATGSGLGAWIAKAFIAASGGDIYVSSEGLGLGTKVTIMLPVPATQPDESAATADD